MSNATTTESVAPEFLLPTGLDAVDGCSRGTKMLQQGDVLFCLP